ncbi:unnamed protein product [Gongylonema pulchrum]|uniref:MMS1_N domain-containing protein n=1 Tax=Gongylonema pulchrum TaxID=637853 RepID=A0A183DTJ5_9BILA|nr:unnamed protein product [Gongylonema pulchrum]
MSTSRTTTIYKLNFDSTVPSISLMRKLNICGTQLLFTSSSLFIATGSFKICVLRFDDHTIEENPEVITERENAGEIVRLHSNMNETSFVMLTTRNELFILDLDEKCSSG